MVTLTYLTDLARVDEALPDHLAWLDRQYADGVFLASGRRVPRTGGVILAGGVDRAELDRRLATDPFAARRRRVRGHRVRREPGRRRPGPDARGLTGPATFHRGADAARPPATGRWWTGGRGPRCRRRQRAENASV